MKRTIALLLSIFLLLGALAGCGGPEETVAPAPMETPATPAASAPTEEGPAETPAMAEEPEEKVKFPAFEGTELRTGAPLSDADFADYDLTLVNVWTTWCGPCRGELPALGELAESYASKGVRVLGILLEEEEEAAETAREILDQAGADYPVFQPEGDFFYLLAYSIMYVPTSFMVDRDGNLVGEPIVSANDLAGWEAAVDAALEAAS